MTEKQLSPLKQALIALDEMQSRIDELERGQTEPIAVIGVACRFPGGPDPDAFWNFLEAGLDGVRKIPATRWTVEAGADENLATRWAGLLESLDTFDATYFGISPREATHMDPQQRLLLEVAHEALERAGLPIERLMGTRTGVFVGFMGSDYGRILARIDPLDVYSGLGNATSIVAGRISYMLGLQGPSMVVDTACSSSLVAVHLACQSLRNRESDLALAGGVNAILDPEAMAATAQVQALSPDGRCKTFDASANGFVRGEGCGVVVLKRLSDAERDGDPIWAIIRGSVVNQDGRSTGLTAPNVLSQQAMLRRALEVARLSPEDLGYVETHGTGTSLGDPIEFEALREVLGQTRADGSTCVLGALKTNVGHMEAAAGIGGLIKAILCLQHEAIPKNLHFKTLNPRMSLEGTPFVIPTGTIPWKRNGKPRRAGVSGFGISGTNAHVILEEAPLRDEKPFQEASSYLLPLSAKTPEAIVAMAKSYQEWLSSHDEPLHQVAYTTSLRRSHLEHRLGVVGTSKAEIVSALGAFVAGENPPNVVAGKNAQTAPKVVFVFPGQGSQWVGMGRQLYREEPAFRDALDACDAAIRKEAGFSVVEELDKPEETSRFADIGIIQPLLFAMEVALAALWRSWGVEPAAVIGHSMGEVAAAFVAGALSMQDAAAIICRRSALLRKVAGKGAMALVELTLPEAEKALTGFEGRLSIAVSNGPRSTVIAGDPGALDDVLRKLEQDGVFCQRIKTNVASHSPQMDVLVNDVLASLADITSHDLRIPMRSTVTGELIRGSELTARYWADNLRKPVLFSQAVETWFDDASPIFLELSPQPALLPFIDENLQVKKVDGAVLASLRFGRDERQTMLLSLAAMHARGVAVNWQKFFPDGGRVVELPTYPWQRERYWIDDHATPQRLPHSQHVHGAQTVDPLAECIYDVVWREAKSLDVPSFPKSRMWLVFADRTGLGDMVIERLLQLGQQCVVVRAGSSYADLSPNEIRIDYGNPEDYNRIFKERVGEADHIEGVVHFLSLDVTSFEQTTPDTLIKDLAYASVSATYLSQAMLHHEFSIVPRLFLITRGAQSVHSGDSVSVTQAPILGLGKTIALEHAELRCTRIDLPSESSNHDTELLLRELGSNVREDQIALRGQTRYLCRIVRGVLQPTSQSLRQIRADRTYLITGGLGGLGLSLAGWFVEQGARHVVLVGRNGPNEQAQKAIQAMTEVGAHVHCEQVDVSRENDVDRLFARIHHELPPVGGIVHAAMVLDDHTLLELSAESFQRVYGPKALGAWNLHRHGLSPQLDFFVMYSSAASLLGSPGQANYCASNAYLDALCRERTRNGLPGMSIQWGAFAEVGAAVAYAQRGSRFSRRGIIGLSPAEGLEAFRRLLANPRPEVGFLRIETRQWLAFYPPLAGVPFVEELRQTDAERGEPWSPQTAAPKDTLPPERTKIDEGLREKIWSMTPRKRQELLASHMRDTLGRILGLRPESIDLAASFHVLGMDSLMFLELRNALEASVGVRIAVRDIMGSARLDALIAFILDRMGLGTALENRPAAAGPGRWIVVPAPNPAAKVRLICFPYAGGGASIYTPWTPILRSEVELCAIQPPGRQERGHEPFMQSTEEMVSAIVVALLPYLDKPFAMFGHCFGVITMIEVMRILREQYGVLPLHVFASGAPAYHSYFVPRTSLRTNDEFIDILRQAGFGHASVLDDSEAIRDLLPVVRNDFDVASKFVPTPFTPFEVPFTAFAGREDGFAPPHSVQQWVRATKSRFDCVVFPGEHYFIVPERNMITHIVSEEIRYRLAFLEQQRNCGKWFMVPLPRVTPRMRLFCFPGMCQSSVLFDSWPALFGEDVEVCILERPGHLERASEMPLGQIEEIVDILVHVMQGYQDRPFAFCGLNVGSILMYALVRRLRHEGKPLPCHLFVGASMGPSTYFMAPTHQNRPQQLMQALRGLNGLFTPGLSEWTISAECAVAASFAYMDEAPFDIPIDVFAGEDDDFVPQEAARLWQRETTQSFEFHVVPGAHDVMSQPSASLIQTIKKRIAC